MIFYIYVLANLIILPLLEKNTTYNAKLTNALQNGIKYITFNNYVFIIILVSIDLTLVTLRIWYILLLKPLIKIFKKLSYPS